MSLVYIQLHLLVRFVKLTGFSPSAEFADDLLEDFHGLQTAPALVTLDVQFHAAVRSNGDFKFALGHGFGSAIPMSHLQADGLVFVHFLFHHHVLPGADLLEQPLMNIFLHYPAAQFLAQRMQLLVRETWT